MEMQIFNSARSERNIRIGVALAFVAVTLVALTTWKCISALVSDAQWVEHSETVLDGIDSLDGQLTRREATERMYQFRHDAKLLHEYRDFSAQILGSVSNLRQLLADNGEQLEHLRQLDDLLQQANAAFASASAGPAKGVLLAADNGIAMAISSQLRTMRAAEHRLLLERRHTEQESIRRTYTVLGALGMILAALLVGTYLIGRNALRTRKRALDESAHLNAELEMTNLALEHKRQEADHANRLKSQFLASMSHELRTPLNAISGFSELLSDQVAGPLNEKQKRFVGHIRDGSKHLLQLINDILDLSRIEAGETRLEITTLSPAVVLDEVIAGVSSLVREKAIEVRAACDPGFLLEADRRRLKQILYNLLSNALKFTPANGRITVRVARSGGFLAFEVIDTGPGIAEADQQIIFEEFRQAAPTANGVKEGTGLGLAITKKLVEKHGGMIEVESEPGKGSCFRFRLPIHQPGSSGAAPGETAPAILSPSSVPAASPLVLVVDDDENARELICNVLESSGYRVATAGSSAAALEAARELKPDLITLDLLMPGGNGFGTLYDLKHALRESLPPVIIVSVVDDRGIGFALGAADYLIKPVSKNDLLTAVRRHLQVPDAGILIIDDDPAMLELAREVFSQPGVSLHLAASGREGLHVAESNRVDAIVLDLIMPEMDGFEFLCQLRKVERLAHIPVSVLTSRDLTDHEVDQLKSTVSAVFRKDQDWRPGLVHEIAQSLARRQADGISAA